MMPRAAPFGRKLIAGCFDRHGVERHHLADDTDSHTKGQPRPRPDLTAGCASCVGGGRPEAGPQARPADRRFDHRPVCVVRIRPRAWDATDVHRLPGR